MEELSKGLQFGIPSTGEGAVKSKWEDIIIDGNSVKDLGKEEFILIGRIR